MTKTDLEQLRALKNEIRLLEEELKSLPVISDSVKGSMIDFPHIEHNIAIRGVDINIGERLRRRLQRKLEELQDRLEDMEVWLDRLEESEMRTILRLRFRNGMTHEQIAKELGYSRTAIASKLERFFKNQIA